MTRTLARTLTLEPLDPHQPDRRRIMTRTPLRPPARSSGQRWRAALLDALALAAVVAALAYACVWAMRLAPYIGG